MSDEPTWAEIFRRILFNVRAWRTWRDGDIAQSCSECGALLSLNERGRCDDCIWLAHAVETAALVRIGSIENPTLAQARQQTALYEALRNAQMQNAVHQPSMAQLAAMQNMTADQQQAALLGGMFGVSLGDLSGMLFNRRPH